MTAVFFFVQSNDPWMLDPAENISVVDRPLYRAQRMFYPMLAGGAGLFNPDTITWMMLIINLLAMGLGSWAVATIAMEMGGSPWWGLAFVLNVGFLSEMNIGAAGVLAGATAFGSIVLFLRGNTMWGVVLVTMAVLSREAMLLAAVGMSWFFWKQDERRTALLVTSIPLALVAFWALYLRISIGGGSRADQIQEIGIPFVGFGQALESWLDNPLNLALGLAMMLLFILFVRRVLSSDVLVGWAFAGFVLLAVLFTEQVWRSYFDITRAIAPVITAFVLLVFLSSNAEESV